MIELDKVDYNKLGFFRFKKLDSNYLLTNEVGEYIFLKPELFEKFLAGKLEPKSKIYQELKEKNFIGDQLDKETLAEKYRQKNQFLFRGPSLHIVVITLRCNHKCIYCQTSSCSVDEKGFDMNIATAKKTVDLIFKSPNKSICIEIQGGEPLLNFSVIKFIIEYAKEKNKLENKDLEIRIGTNFSLLDNKKLNYFLEKKIALCTSLDGPEMLHNKTRIFLEGNSYQNTTKWLKKAIKLYRKKWNDYIPGALITVTRFSFPFRKKIIDTYRACGLEGIFLRPVNFLGFACRGWQKVSYSVEEFLKFYKQTLDYIIKLNLKGCRFVEQLSRIFLTKILETKQIINYMDMRSPCGAGVGQVLYNYDGKVYTCDEGRMVEDKDLFQIGQVDRNEYSQIVNHEIVKSLLIASCLDNISCNYCVYKPYCGVCPIYNYVEQGNIFAQIPATFRCKIYRGILDYLFEKLENKQIKEIFKKWIEK